MKNTKKIISLVLAICMLASLAISASAANTVDASGGTGTSSVSVMLCGRISFASPRANLARSPATVPLPTALRFGHSSTPNTETEVHNERNQFAGFLPVV